MKQADNNDFMIGVCFTLFVLLLVYVIIGLGAWLS